MKAFLDLAVLGNPEALKKFLPFVESLLPPGAYRDREIEDRIKERFPESRRGIIRWRRFSDDLVFPVEQNPEAICFGEVLLYPGKIVPMCGELLIPGKLAIRHTQDPNQKCEHRALQYHTCRASSRG